MSRRNKIFGQRFQKPKVDTGPTRYLYVSGLSGKFENRKEHLHSLFSAFGELDDDGTESIELYEDKVASATNALVTLHGTTLESFDCSSVYIRYAELYHPPQQPPEPECTSTTNDIEIPGLTLIEEFVTEAEEELLTSEYCGPDAPWLTQLTRQVQHFGFEFNYESLLIDTDNSRTHPIPPLVQAMLLDRIQRRVSAPGAAQASPPLPLVQMTINEYQPGQGIAPHVDTETCFGPQIFILSILSGITMTLTRCDSPATPVTHGDHVPSAAPRNTRTLPLLVEPVVGAVLAAEQPVRKHLWLPRRSLLCLEGEARYRWSHCISSRTLDKLPGLGIVRRSRRVSFTLRSLLPSYLQHGPSALSTVAADEKPKEVAFQSALGNPDRRAVVRLRGKELGENSVHSQQGKGGTDRGKNGRSALNKPAKTSKVKVAESVSSVLAALAASSLGTAEGTEGRSGVWVESEFVHKVYDGIATHWHHTRGIRKVYWQRVKDYLELLPPFSLVADVGSGDGKYFGVNPALVVIGCDRSPRLLEVSRDVNNETFCCDAVQLPLLSGSFDAAICIAVLHHLSTEERRVALLSELVRILRPGGSAMVQAWAKEQGDDSRRTFADQDVLVPWHLQKHWEHAPHPAAQPHRQTSSGATDECLSELKDDQTVLEGGQANGVPKQPPDVAGGGGGPEAGRDEDGRLVYQRYCHVYCEGELEALCAQVKGCVVAESGWDKGNWFVRLQKLGETSETRLSIR